MKGEKTLASGNILRWQVVEGLTEIGVEATYRTLPSAADLRETQDFAATLMPPPGAALETAFIGMGEQGRCAARAAFEANLGRSSD